MGIILKEGRGLMFQALGSAINSFGMKLTGSQSKIHLNVLKSRDREHLFVSFGYL